MIRIIAKLFAVTVLLCVFVHVGPLSAAPVTWVSSTGSDGNPYPCTAAKPCATFAGAVNSLDNDGQINCLGSPGFSQSLAFTGFSATIDCAGVWETTSNLVALSLNGNQIWKIRNLTISGAPGGSSAIKVVGGGTLIIENCVFENFSGAALDIEPTSTLNLVVTNSRISTSGAGVMIKPAAGGLGSVTATFNGVTIVDNTGGGLKTDTTNGAVSVDISNSTISNNFGNGLNAVSGGSGGTNMLNVKNTVIARNGTGGVQVNGTNAAALIDMTLLDSNASGALTTINGGRLLTYGNNHIIGSAGSGFTGTAPSQ
jgi:hypothetical protein